MFSFLKLCFLILYFYPFFYHWTECFKTCRHFNSTLSFTTSTTFFNVYFRVPPGNLDSRTTITIGDKTFDVEADDLELIGDLGRGAYGVVEKMKHIPSGTIMAVKVGVLISCVF